MSYITLEVLNQSKVSTDLLVEKDKHRYILKKYTRPYQGKASFFAAVAGAFSNRHTLAPVQLIDEPEIALVTEYAPRTSLSSLLGVPTEQIESFVAATAVLLADFHAAGLCLNQVNQDVLGIQNNKPLLFNTNWCSTSLCADGLTRHQPDLASPEQILHGTHHPAADIFALGMLWYGFLAGHSPVEEFSEYGYERTVTNTAAFNAWLKQCPGPDLLKRMLAWSAVDRPSAGEVAFALAADQEETAIAALKANVFACQLEGVRKLWQVGSLEIIRADEPETIIALAALKSELEQKRLLLLDESYYYFNPVGFEQDLACNATKKQNGVDLVQLVESLKDDYKIVLKREPQLFSSELFDRLTALPGVAQIRLGKASELPAIEHAEARELLVRLRFNSALLGNFITDYTPLRPRDLRKATLAHDRASYQRNGECSRFMAATDISLNWLTPIKVWEEWQTYLADDLQRGNLRFYAGGLERRIDEIARSQVQVYLLERMQKTAQEQQDHLRSGLIAWGPARPQIKKALAHWEEHATFLADNGHARAAADFLSWVNAKIPTELVTESLLSARANTLLQLGELEEAARLYEQLGESDKFKPLALAAGARINQKLGHTRQALASWMQAAQQYKQLEQQTKYLDCLLQATGLAILLSEFKTAEDCLQIIENHELAKEQQVALLSLQAGLYWQLGNYEQAQFTARQALEQGGKTLPEPLAIIVLCRFALGRDYQGELQDFIIALAQKQSTSKAVWLLPAALNVDKQSELLEMIDENPALSTPDKLTLAVYFLGRGNYVKASQLAGNQLETNKNALAFFSSDESLLENQLAALAAKNAVAAFHQLALQAAWFNKLLSPHLVTVISEFCQKYPHQALQQLISQAGPGAAPTAQHLDAALSLADADNQTTLLQQLLARVQQLNCFTNLACFSLDTGGYKVAATLNQHSEDALLLVDPGFLADAVKLGQLRFAPMHPVQGGPAINAIACPINQGSNLFGVLYGQVTVQQLPEPVINTVAGLAKLASAMLARLGQGVASTKPELEDDTNPLMGQSRAMRFSLTLLQAALNHNAPVLIWGTTGRGKSFLANWSAKNTDTDLITVDCALAPLSVQKQVIKQAATKTKPFIIIENIDTATPELQTGLLQLLNAGKTQLVVTAAEPAIDLSKKGKLNQNLANLLQAAEIEMPSLAERSADLQELYGCFLGMAARRFERDLHFTSGALNWLVSEAKNLTAASAKVLIERAALISADGKIDQQALDPKQTSLMPAADMPDKWIDYKNWRNTIVAKLDGEFAHKLLAQTDGNIQQASVLGGLTRKQIYRLLEKDDK